MSSIDESPTDVDALGEKKRRPWALVGTGLSLVLVVLLGLPVVSTLQPGYYERYPELRVRMDEWRHSTHAQMSCIGCHVDPGIKGFASFAVRSIPAFYTQLVQGTEHASLLRAPDTVACRKCHTTSRQISPDGDLRIPHRAHVEILKINCVDCHAKLVHHPNTKGINKPQMGMCLERCHDGVKAKNECRYCHTAKHVPESHRRSDWLKIHSTQTKKLDCGSCHAWAPDFCVKCHANRPKSHVASWKKGHSIRAKVSTKGCLFCHKQLFCKKCH